MANWKQKLDFSGFYKNDEFTIVQKAEKVAGLLLTLKINDDAKEELEGIIERFNEVQYVDADDQIEDFDDCMAELYDFADSERIWINTF